MKIALDISQIVYQGTGVARYTYQLSKHLLQLNSPHQFVFYAGSLRRRAFFKALQHHSPFSQATWKIYPFSPRIADLLFNRFHLSLDPFLGSIDVFHASDWTHPPSTAPSLTTIHDLVFLKYPQTLDPLIVNTQHRRLQSALKYAHHFIVDSQSTKQDLIKQYNVPSHKITVIYLAADNRFQPQQKTKIAQVKKKYHIYSQYLLSVGTLEPRKNLRFTIDAFLTLIKEKKFSSLNLVIVGQKGWGQKLNINHPQIIFTGYLPDEDLPPLYAGAQAFLYPSLYEGFGLPALEAMACGTPVVTSNVSSLPEIVGSAGVLINPTQLDSFIKGIKYALQNHSSLSQASLARAQHFSWTQTARHTLQVYESLAHHD